MEVLVLVIVLVVLIVVHEAGHFFAAKIAGIRVSEAGLGYPPKIAGFTYGETQYTINWLPFGGFVRIDGEDGKDEASIMDGKPAVKSTGGRLFTDKNRFVQAIVLVAGIAMNLIFAWLLLSLSLYMGVARELSPAEAASAPDAALTVAQVVPGSPAEQAGVKPGDAIKQAIAGDDTFSSAEADAFIAFVAAHAAVPISLDIVRGGKELLTSAKPTAGVVAGAPARPALGIAVAPVGTAREGALASLKDGFFLTVEITKETAIGLGHFFKTVLTFSADLSQVTGPVGIAGAVGSAAKTSFATLVSLTAIISVNLALINLIPIPALDGGRLLFVIIESIIRRPIKASVANAVNTVGFALLLLLMAVVTAHDIFKIVV